MAISGRDAKDPAPNQRLIEIKLGTPAPGMVIRGSFGKQNKAQAMQVPLQITVRDMPHSDALDARIRDKASKLEGFYPDITSCRVTIEELRKHHQQGRHFQVSIDVRVPGRELVANRAHHEDVYVALRDAFDAVRRQLEEEIRLKRGQVKAHDTRGNT
jgi:ribosomal subunit interface protein